MQATYFKIKKDKLLIFFLSISTLSLLSGIIFLLLNADKGFDFTDEGFYLNSLEGNFYKNSISYFFAILKPLYLILDKNIIYLRQANILISIYLGYLLISTVLSGFNFSNYLFQKNKLLKIIMVLALSSISLLEIMQLKIYTPSYNNLCFYGVSLVSIALIKIYSKQKNNLLNTFFLSGGISILLLSKPSSGLIIIFSIFIGSLISRKKFKLQIFSILISILITIFCIAKFNNVQLVNLFNIYRELYSDLQIKEYSSNSIILDSLTLIKECFLNLHLIFYWVSYYMNIIFEDVRIIKNYKLNNFLSKIYLISPLFLIFIFSKNLIFFIAAFAAFPISILITNFLLDGIKLDKYKLILFLNIFLMPFFYTIGTDNSYLYTLSRVPIFFVVSGLVIVSEIIKNKDRFPDIKLKRFFIIFMILSNIIFSHFLDTFNSSPYRQDFNLFSFKKSFLIREKTILKLSDASFNYLDNAINSMKDNKFKFDQSILDLTGRSPGFIYAVGGKPLLSPWIIGGYPSSNKTLKNLLNKVKLEELGKAWVLIEPNSFQALDLSLLRSKGINLDDEEKYKLVFKVDSSKINPYNSKNIFQYLYKPIFD